MKKYLALILAVLMVVALCAGCGESTTDEPTDEPTADVSEPTGDAGVPGDTDAPPADGDAAEPPADKDDGMPSGDKGDGAPSDEAASGGQSGNSLPLETNAVIPTKDSPETYTADEAGWKEYMMDCAYYAMGEDTDSTKLPATYYDIMNGGMIDMFVNMWGCDSQETFLANGGVPVANPWDMASGVGTPDSVPSDESSEEPAA